MEITEEVFDDYYDEQGNLHVDARKKLKYVRPINLKYIVNKNKDAAHEYTDEQIKRLVIHHCNLIR